MADNDTQPHVVARIKAKVGKGGWHEFGPDEASVVKDAAADWFRALRFTKPDAKIAITVAQESPDVPWVDGGTFKWSGDAAAGCEYSAQFCERFPAWGRSR